MREIKFRGYSVDIDKWVYGDLLNYCPKLPVILAIEGEQHECEASSIGQYTGLKDQNGTEIYEGDILGKTFHWDLFVRFQNGKFMLYDTNLVRRNNDYTYDLYRNVVEGYCVIGNIFENPELIER